MAIEKTEQGFRVMDAELGIDQPINPATGLTFTTEEEAQAWETGELARIAAAQAEGEKLAQEAAAAEAVRIAAGRRAQFKADLAALRYAVETGGTTLNGVPILTGREDQMLTLTAYVSLTAGFEKTVCWKNSAGETKEMSLEELTPIALACFAHSQKCRRAEGAVLARIDAATDAELVGFDVAAAWATALTEVEA